MVMSDDFGSTNVLASSVDDVSSLRNLNTPRDEIALGLDLPVHAFDEYTVNAIEPVTTLSLTYPKLIDWNSNTTNEVLTFQNDYALTCYLNIVEPVTSSTSEHSVNMTKSNIKYLSHKIKKMKSRRFNGENQIVAVLKPKKVKTKDVSKGENLSEEPEDEIFDALPSHF